MNQPGSSANQLILLMDSPDPDPDLSPPGSPVRSPTVVVVRESPPPSPPRLPAPNRPAPSPQAAAAARLAPDSLFLP